MKWVYHHVRVAVALALHSACVLTAALPPVVATLPADQLFPGGVRDASIVFLSEDTLALLAWSRNGFRGGTQMRVVRIESGRLLALAQNVVPFEGQRLYAVSKGRILIGGQEHSYLYSQDLVQKFELPIFGLRSVFPGTDVAGSFKPRGSVFRLTNPPAPIPRRGGELMATSDSVLVYRTEGRFEPITPEGIGCASIPAPSNGAGLVDVAGPGRLFFSGRKKDRITDLCGKTIHEVQPPRGWGYRHGWSSDGARLLFDHYVRNVPLSERLFEPLASALGLEEIDNGEIVRVIDVSTGTICFDFETSKALLGALYTLHADISPSGRLVAVASRTELTVYRLPAVCTGE